MSRRGDGEGTIFKRKDGRWVARISLGRDASGRRQTKTAYGKTRREVAEKLEQLMDDRKKLGKKMLDRESVGVYLDAWLKDDVEINLAPRTYQAYEGAVRLHIKPYIGKVKLVKLTGDEVDRWQSRLKRDGITDDARQRAGRVLNVALRKAIRLRRIPFNPMEAVTLPRRRPKEVIPLEPEQCHALIEACKAHRLGDIFIVAAMTGLRIGELLALDWSAVNLKEGVLSVRHTLQNVSGKLSTKTAKTDAGRRMVTLGEEAIEALKRRQQKATDEGLGTTKGIVFPNTVGKHQDIARLRRDVWLKIRETAGISDKVTIHDLRHTQASLLLAAGVDMKVIQKRLGHADFKTTANIYSHLLQNAQTEAAEKLDSLLNARKPSEYKTRVHKSEANEGESS